MQRSDEVMLCLACKRVDGLTVLDLSRFRCGRGPKLLVLCVSGRLVKYSTTSIGSPLELKLCKGGRLSSGDDSIHKMTETPPAYPMD